MLYIIRHGKVDYRPHGYCDSGMFDRDCEGYDHAPVTDEDYTAPDTGCRKIFISTLSRSRQTAGRLFGEEEFIVSELIDEVPLVSAFDTKMKFPAWFWKVAGRVQWFLNSPRQPEGRARTLERAREFITMVCKDDEDAVVVTHGFFMHTLLSELRKAGFRTDHSRVRYKNGECIVARRQADT